MKDKNLTLEEIQKAYIELLEQREKEPKQRTVKVYAIGQASLDMFHKALREEFDRQQKLMNKKGFKKV